MDKGFETNLEIPSARRRLAKRVESLGPSCTLELKQMCKYRQSLGLPIFDFGLGENKWPVCSEVKQAFIDSMKNAETGYIEPAGLPELRQEILRWLELEDQYSIEDVIVAGGAKQVLNNIFVSICDPGDTVLLAHGPWVSYAPIIECASARAVQVVSSAHNSKLTVDDLREALDINPLSKAFLLNNPCNPTGQLYSQEEVDALVELCVQRRVYFILDRLYWRVLFQDDVYPSPRIDSQTKQWIIQVDGLSKNFAKLGGVRIGWSLGPSDLSEVMMRFQSHYSSGAATISQYAALAALRYADWQDMVADLEKKRECFWQLASKLPLVKCFPTEAAFYSWWDVSQCFGMQTAEGKTINDSNDLSHYLLSEYGVVTASGEAFGQDGFLRLCFFIDEEQIHSGLEAVRLALEALRKP